MSSQSKTCRKQGYRMPAEWQKHDAIWLAWPYDPTTFPNRVERVEAAYVQIVKEIHQGERVNLFVKDTMSNFSAEVFWICGVDGCGFANHSFYENGGFFH